MKFLAYLAEKIIFSICFEEEETAFSGRSEKKFIFLDWFEISIAFSCSIEDDTAISGYFELALRIKSYFQFDFSSKQLEMRFSSQSKLKI